MSRSGAERGREGETGGEAGRGRGARRPGVSTLAKPGTVSQLGLARFGTSLPEECSAPTPSNPTTEAEHLYPTFFPRFFAKFGQIWRAIFGKKILYFCFSNTPSSQTSSSFPLALLPQYKLSSIDRVLHNLHTTQLIRHPSRSWSSLKH